ncbi:hypothetical protein A3742_17140 [Oleiphilus sp. HI0071]|nr:hypothetical protein A3737_05700 [Oleiphilus sp. HI0065]KZY79272.1 hypothetical protein A3742_14550 [Oleiphilus sp. HI0071]KZY92502.1 hypothetical protein A3744_01995 [Oleiphilus sp. HI0073]KZZ13932.1 hypothetical protein A3750_16175 [Oleiphilus sp. HI0079]KZZ18644.1 hypothetical protein A3751_07480 [Oleiphilus sp. HI0080]KZZ43779.1 hypothetical protein A3758_04130 [Oleiphilus sp. HI0118]KZZ60991.1 hypothetical protein A3760_04605 [Oleiphilus sp. HI0122]KZZ71380.1 hypothetical protein A37
MYLILWRYWGINQEAASTELNRRGFGNFARLLLKVLALPFVSHDRFILIIQAEEHIEGIEHTTIKKSALYSLAWSLPLVAGTAFVIYPTPLFYLYAFGAWPISGIFLAYMGFSILSDESQPNAL